MNKSTTKSAVGRVVLVRHAQSQWNVENRFSGWADPGLSAHGNSEALAAGRLLRAGGMHFDTAYHSLQKRSRDTLALIVRELGREPLGTRDDWRLNERHYGALEGLDKTEVGRRYGEEQVLRWRRGYYDRPPRLDRDDPRHPRFQQRFARVPREQLPDGENLRDTEVRVTTFWREAIMPRVGAGARVLVVAHGNTLRALVRHLEGLAVREVEHLEIPTARPFGYRVTQEGGIVSLGYLDDPGHRPLAA
jgi:2,3-bisphosphoglycerate-dependent phosphoglycerate mutase